MPWAPGREKSDRCRKRISTTSFRTRNRVQNLAHFRCRTWSCSSALKLALFLTPGEDDPRSSAQLFSVTAACAVQLTAVERHLTEARRSRSRYHTTTTRQPFGFLVRLSTIIAGFLPCRIHLGLDNVSGLGLSDSRTRRRKL